MFIFASLKVQSRLKKSHTQDEDFDYSDNLHHRQLWDQGEEKELRQFYSCHENSLASTDFHFSFTKIKIKAEKVDVL